MFLVAALVAPAVQAADQRSLVDLLNRVPEVPATPQDAVKWFDKDGKLVHPVLLALKADLESAKHANDGASNKDAAAATSVTVQGLENVGIDVARMKSDPAYVKELQERLKRMSPQEQMAFTQKMMQPQNQASVHEVRAMANESPAVGAAVDVAQTWNDRQQSRHTAHAALWKETEQSIKSAQKPFGLTKPTIEYDSPGCEQACLAQWHAYGEKLWPLVLARETTTLDTWRTALQKDRASLSALLQEGDRLLAPTQYGAAAQSRTDRTWINGYYTGLLAEIERCLDETESTARRSATVVNAGVERLFWAGSR
jgi:hypothetical protein